jgi:hypothetical protein
MLGALEDRGLDPGLAGAVQRPRAGLVRDDAGNLDSVPSVDPVEDRLEIGPRAGREYGDPEGHWR